MNADISRRVTYDFSILQTDLLEILTSFEQGLQANVAQVLGHDVLDLVHAGVRQAIERIADDCTAVVVGDFKRGKSTLINALLGEAVTSVNVTPETITITEIRQGPAFKANLCLTDGGRIALSRAELATDLLHPILEKVKDRVSHLELFYPIDALTGICWIDTPGTGDVFQEFDERIERYLVNADLLLVVLSPISPLSASERAFLRAVVMPQEFSRIIFIVNMIDFAQVPEEIDRVLSLVRQKALALFPTAQVFAVSALDEIARQRGHEHPNMVLADRLSHLFDDLRGTLETMVVANRQVIKLDRAIELATLILNAFDQKIVLLREAMQVDNTKLETAIAACEDDASQIETRFSEYKRVLREELRALAAQSKTWMHAFSERLEHELRRDLGKANLEDLERYFQFFLSDILRRALQACMSTQHDAITAAVSQVSQTYRDDLARMTDFKSLQTMTTATNFSSPCWDNEYVFAFVVEQFLGLGPVVHIIGGLMDIVQQDKLVGKFMRGFSAAMPALKDSLADLVDRSYRNLADDLEAWVDEVQTRNREAGLSAMRQARVLHGQTSRSLEQTNALLMKALDLSSCARAALHEFRLMVSSENAIEVVPLVQSSVV